MVTFNILGDCVSRDIITPLIKANKAEVLQYHAFSNPVTLFSNAGKTQIEETDFVDDGSKFRKRCAILDFNKTALDYVFAKKSDFLVFDILDSRLSILQKDGHQISVSGYIRETINSINPKFELSTYEKLSPFSDISATQWEETIIKLCDIIKQHYKPEQIVLVKHFGAINYISKNLIAHHGNIFSYIRNSNQLAKMLFEIIEKHLDGCHVIDFPNYVLGDADNIWGLGALHYHELFYEYGSRAMEVCISGLQKEEELRQLNQLRDEYSRLFLNKYLDLIIPTVNAKTEAIERALHEANKNNVEKLCSAIDIVTLTNNKIALLEQSINKLTEQIATDNNSVQKVDGLEQSINKLTQQIIANNHSAQKEISRLNDELHENRNQIDALTHSRSYKIGRFITFIPRKLKSIFKRPSHKKPN